MKKSIFNRGTVDGAPPARAVGHPPGDEERPDFSFAPCSPRHADGMTLLHCPLCFGLAVLSVLRAASHLTLVGLHLSQGPAAGGGIGPRSALSSLSRA